MGDETYTPTTEQVRNNMAFGAACAWVALHGPDRDPRPVARTRSTPVHWPPVSAMSDRMRVVACTCGADFRATHRPSPEVIDPWVAAHAAHDVTLRDRAEETWR